MSGTLLLRRAGAADPALAAPVVRPAGAELPGPGRPRIYLAPVGTPTDQAILCASLASEGMPLPAFLPTSRGVFASRGVFWSGVHEGHHGRPSG